MKPATVNHSPGDRAEPSAELSFSLAGEIRTDSATEQRGRELARAMRRRWCQGEQPATEAFLNQHPELWQQPEAAVELVYEEYCLRQAAGQGSVEADILRRFPQWAGPLRVLLDCHRVLHSGSDRPAFPAVGDTVGGFRLLADLGRGSRGQVFLASQTALADRPVVLKITPLDGGEHLSLARLQHTNIVPLHSFLDDPARDLRILCMPYFGRATLASLLQLLADVPFAARTGQHVVAAIDRVQEPSAPHVAPGGAARQMLAHVSYVQAMCWITACLADALHFAHERGLVHFDLKPSNVLLAADGQPMLLDFHLAHAPIRPEGPLPDNLGGTPGYMPAEQRAAMQALQNGRPVEITVDARADLYALGAMLYQSLGGPLPIAADSPTLLQLNPHVSVGLSDITAKCVAHRSEDRYAHAAALADDLRRHLTDLPLVGVPNRSLAERWHKWRRRRPNMIRSTGMFGVVAAAVMLLLAGAWWQIRDRQQQAEHALRDGQAQLQSGRDYAQAVQTFEHGLALAESLPFQPDLQRQLREQRTTAKRLLIARQLHDLADEIRVVYGTDSLPPARLRSLASHCRAFWEKRTLIVDSLSSNQATDLMIDLQDIAIFAADLEIKLSPGSESTAGRREALRLLDEAEALFGPSAVLEHERQSHRQALGLAQIAGSSSPGTAAPVPRTAWEHCALGRAYLASGELARASEELAAALALDPAGRWPNFYSGLCAYRLRRYEDALTAFSVCLGTAPNSASCFFNRGLVYTALGRPEQALHDYDRALHIDPTLAAAALNRGMLHFEQQRLDKALADLRLALRHGADAASVHYNIALVHLAAHDPAAALGDVQQALAHNPTLEPARQLRDTLQSKTGRPKTGH